MFSANAGLAAGSATGRYRPFTGMRFAASGVPSTVSPSRVLYLAQFFCQRLNHLFFFLFLHSSPCQSQSRKLSRNGCASVIQCPIALFWNSVFERPGKAATVRKHRLPSLVRSTIHVPNGIVIFVCFAFVLFDLHSRIAFEPLLRSSRKLASSIRLFFKKKKHTPSAFFSFPLSIHSPFRL